jgi:hypothetical protein
LSSQTYNQKTIFKVHYDLTLSNSSKRKGVVGFKNTSSFDIWKFNLDSILSIKKVVSIIPKLVDSIEYSGVRNRNEVDSAFLLSSFFIYDSKEGCLTIDYNSGNIYIIDESITYAGRVRFQGDRLMILEDLDEDCIWVNGEINWRDKKNVEMSIKQMEDGYLKVMDELARQGRKRR